LSTITIAQTPLGISNSNFSGIYGIPLNPSSMVGSKLYMDFNFLSLGTTLGSNYIYVHGDDLKIFKFIGVNSSEYLPEYYDAGNSRRYVDMYRDDEDKFGSASMQFIGPSGMVVYGKHAWGIVSSYKTQIAFRNVSQDVANYLYEALDYDIQHDIPYHHADKTMQFGLISYMELSLSYAYNFYRKKWDSFTGGISVKPLFGTAGLYGNIETVDYYVDNYDTAYIDNANFEFAHATPFGGTDASLIKGYGVAFDLGVTYQKTHKGHGRPYRGRLCAQRFEAYNFKAAFAVLDLGFISFNRGAKHSLYENTQADWARATDTLKVATIEDIDNKLSHYFSNGSTPIVRDRFKMTTSPAVSVQVDYPINAYNYINGTIIYGFNIGESYLKRESVVGFTYRYERSRFEINVPLSIYDFRWKQPKVGLAVRYGNFFIGSDKLSNFFGLNDFTGFDIYFGLRLNLTKNFRM